MSSYFLFLNPLQKKSFFFLILFVAAIRSHSVLQYVPWPGYDVRTEYPNRCNSDFYTNNSYLGSSGQDTNNITLAWNRVRQ